MGFTVDGVFITQGLFKPWDLRFDQDVISIEGRINSTTIRKTITIEDIINRNEFFLYLKFSIENGWDIEAEEDWPFEDLSDFIKSKPELEQSEDGDSITEYTLDFIVFPLYHFYKEEKEYKEIQQLESTETFYTKLVGSTDLTQIQSIFNVRREGGDDHDLVLAPKLVSAFNFNTPL